MAFLARALWLRAMSAPAILICTLNARFSHAALGLRYLMANMGELTSQAAIREFTINDQAAHIAERLLAESPRIIGFGIYIWNLNETLSVIGLLKAIAPNIKIVIGGPEVTHDYEHEAVVALADVLITGEADLTFATV